MSVLENRSLAQASGTQIKDRCAAAGFSHVAEDLECEGDMPNATLHYINSKPSDTGNTLLYFHGGGYCLPIIGKGHTGFALEFAKAASIKKVVLLEYTLAPELQYPGQIVQALSALRLLLRTHKPSEIVIGGDSCGGNLALAVISHLIKPSNFASRITLDEDLRGSLLISPWVKFDQSAPSFKYNARTDLISDSVLEDLIVHYKPTLGEVYADPATAGPEFWNDMPVRKTLVTAGSWEVFLDDIQLLAKNMGSDYPGAVGKHGPVELAVAAKEAHIECVIDIELDIKNGIMLKQCLDWARRL